MGLSNDSLEAIVVTAMPTTFSIQPSSIVDDPNQNDDDPASAEDVVVGKKMVPSLLDTVDYPGMLKHKVRQLVSGLKRVSRNEHAATRDWSDCISTTCL